MRKPKKTSAKSEKYAVLAVAGIFMVMGYLLAKAGIKLPVFNNNQNILAGVTYEVKLTTNVPYGSDPLQKLDVCRPKGLSGRLPTIIFIHGGGGDKTDARFNCNTYAQKGYVGIAINYRQDPYAYPVAYNDAKLALSFVRRQKFVEPTRIATFGGSMGGWLSALLGTVESTDKVKCVMSNFGITDFTDPNFRDNSFGTRSVASLFFGGVTYAQNPGLYSEASPVFYLSANDANFAYTRSINDQLVPHSQLEILQTALANVGKTLLYLEYVGTGAGHANSVTPEVAQEISTFQQNFISSCL